MPWRSALLGPRRYRLVPQKLTFDRAGILAMILCLALGIANIFTFNVVIIIFCALAL